MLNQTLLLHLALALGLLIASLMVVQVLRSRRQPAARIGWLVLIVTLPYLGVPLYLALGTRKLLDKPPAPPPAPHPGDDPIDRLLDGLGAPSAHGGDRVVLHNDGAHALAALDDILRTAHQRVDLCVYQLCDDAVGGRWLDRLAQLARRGVQVRVLLDAVGSWGLARGRLKALRRAGVQVARFMPLLHHPRRGRSNLRNHRKLVVVDGRAAWTGGRNLAAQYFTHADAWIDLSLSLRGPAVAVLQTVFERDWALATGQPLPDLPPPAADGPVSGGLRVVPAGPDVAGDPLHDLLLSALGGARRRILAVTPYYVPDSCLQQALCLAARRGLAVDLLLPARSNHPSADLARERYLRELHAAGANIRLLRGTMVHAKALVVDDALAVTGSANLDLRSLFLNFELDLLLRAPEQVRACAAWIENLDKRAHPYRPPAASVWRESLEGLVLLLAYQL